MLTMHIRAAKVVNFSITPHQKYVFGLYLINIYKSVAYTHKLRNIAAMRWLLHQKVLPLWPLSKIGIYNEEYGQMLILRAFAQRG